LARSNSAQSDTGTDFLSKLGTVSTAPPPRDSKGNTVDTLTIPGLAVYGALDYVEKQIVALKKGDIGSTVRNPVYDYFIEKGIDLGKCPTNPKGVDGDNRVEASLQLRRKDSRSALTPEQVAELANHDIPVDHIVVAPHTLRLKPDVFATNKKLVGEMLECLANNGFDAYNLFETQLPTERDLVAKGSLDALFRAARLGKENAAKSRKNINPLPLERVRELLDMIAGPTISCTFHDTLASAMTAVETHVSPPAAAADEPVSETPTVVRTRKGRGG
jgi:hypothetical protein